MIRAFIGIFLLLFFASLGVALHYLSFDRHEIHTALSSVVRVTHIAEPSLSVSYYESRVMSPHSSTNISYPEMSSIDRMDFVYAKQ